MMNRAKGERWEQIHNGSHIPPRSQGPSFDPQSNPDELGRPMGSEGNEEGPKHSTRSSRSPLSRRT